METPRDATARKAAPSAKGEDAARQVTPSSPAASSALTEPEKMKLRERFREQLNLLKQLRTLAAERRKELASHTPSPFKVADYGRSYSIQVEEKYRAYLSEIEGQVPPRTFDDLMKASYETRYLQFLVQLAESEEDVAGTPMKALVYSLLAETNFREALVAELGHQPGIDPQALREAKGADAMLAELRRLAPELSKHYSEKAAKLLPPDPRYGSYLDEQFRSHVVQNVVNTYKSARMFEIEKIEQQATKLAADLNAQLRRLPTLSDERARLATDFSAAIRATEAP